MICITNFKFFFGLTILSSEPLLRHYSNDSLLINVFMGHPLPWRSSIETLTLQNICLPSYHLSIKWKIIPYQFHILNFQNDNIRRSLQNPITLRNWHAGTIFSHTQLMLSFCGIIRKIFLPSHFLLSLPSIFTTSVPYLVYDPPHKKFEFPLRKISDYAGVERVFILSINPSHLVLIFFPCHNHYHSY